MSNVDAARSLIRGQWPIATLFAVLLVVEGVTTHVDDTRRELLLWSLSWLISLIAVLAVRRQLAAACGAAAVMVLITVGANYLGESPLALFSPVTPAETAASMVIIAMAIRYASRTHAVLSVLVLGAAGLHAALTRFVRPGWDLRVPADVFPTMLLLLLAIGAGLYFRARDADRERSLATAVAVAQQEERIALARELHDVVAHHVTGIVVQAQAALTVAAKDPLAAHRLLPGIASSGGDALKAMRRIVGTLRNEHVPDVATTDLDADVRAVVARVSDLGTPVDLQVDLRRPVPPEIARSVLRLVQESLTNVQKHANDASVITVALSTSDGRVRLVVLDDGRDSPVEPVGGSGGYGLIGMRERVELLGGLFSAGPTGIRGWQVLAELPLQEEAR